MNHKRLLGVNKEPNRHLHFVFRIHSEQLCLFSVSTFLVPWLLASFSRSLPSIFHFVSLISGSVWTQHAGFDFYTSQGHIFWWLLCAGRKGVAVAWEPYILFLYLWLSQITWLFRTAEFLGALMAPHLTRHPIALSSQLMLAIITDLQEDFRTCTDVLAYQEAVQKVFQ